MKESLNRKKDLKKAQELNKRHMERMHSVDPDYRDKALVDKIGITPDTKE